MKKTNKFFVYPIVAAVSLLLASLACTIGGGASFEVEDPRMALCSKSQICSVEGVTEFSLLDSKNMCVAWTEVNREHYQGISIYIYDKDNKRVFSYGEPENRASDEQRVCRVIPINTINQPGEYRTELVVSDHVYQPSLIWTLGNVSSSEKPSTPTTKP